MVGIYPKDSWVSYFSIHFVPELSFMKACKGVEMKLYV
jgi:hypothetical protein